MNKERLSNIELLRIVAALGIVIIHIGDGKMVSLDVLSANQIVLYLLESFAHCCVNVFILITGYFLIKSNQRTWGKPIDLLLQNLLVQLAVFVVFILTHKLEFTMRNIALYCSPNNYFIILFITLYIVSPYINKLLNGFSSFEWKVFLIIIISIFSCYAVFVDLYGELLGQKWFGLSPVGAWGNQQGFTIVNFILLYCIGGYIRCNELTEKISSKKASLLFVGSVLICFIWAELNCFLSSQGLRSAWVYHNPFIILMAFSLFVLFSKINIKSRIINSLASAAFMCYIVHTKILMIVNWDGIFRGNVLVMIVAILSFCVAIYFISWLLYKAYALVTKPIFKKLSSTDIKYFDDLISQ